MMQITLESGGDPPATSWWWFGWKFIGIWLEFCGKWNLVGIWMEFGWKPRDAEVGEVELWRLEEILQPAAQLAMEANPYTHHSSVSHAHPNWSLHKHETRVFLERIFRTKKTIACVCRPVHKSFLSKPDWPPWWGYATCWIDSLLIFLLDFLLNYDPTKSHPCT